MKIALIGYRAAGKSTLGRLLARQLGMPFMDVDRGIEERIGGQTLSAFYQQVGEEGFRPLETEVVEAMCALDGIVLAFGAGSLMRRRNREAARRDALVVYLQVPAAELWRRISSDPQSGATRPNLAGGGLREVRQMLAQREPVYLQCADLVLDGTLPPAELAARVGAAFSRARSSRVAD